MKYRNFVTTGEARDQEWIVNHLMILESYIHDDMRAKGFVPVVDQESDVRWWYIKDKNIFGYKVTIKGLKVGRKNAKKYLGIMSQQNIMLDMDGDPQTLQFAGV